MKKQTVFIGFNLSPEIHKRLRQAAQDTDRPVSWIVRDALSKWLDRHEEDAADASQKH